MVEPDRSLPFVERIRNLSATDKVNVVDLAAELSRLAEIRDLEGIRSLSEAMQTWESTGEEETTPEEIKGRIEGNLDYLAFHIDISGGDILSTWGLVAGPSFFYPTAPVEDVRAVYREATGYQPPVAQKA